MKNELPKRFANNIVERPDNLSSGERSQKYDDLAATLKIMEATKAVVLDINECVVLYGKNFKSTIKLLLKRRGVSKVRVAEKNDKIYIWQTKI